MALWSHWNELDSGGFDANRWVPLDERGEHLEPHWDAIEAKALEQSVSAARRTMLNAEPFFVSAEMCDLVEEAAATFKPEPLHASDLLTPCGFLLFERPIQVLAGEPGDEVLTPYSAFSWIGVQRRDGDGVFAVALTTFCDWGNSPDGLPGVWDFEAWEFDTSPERPHVGWWRLAQSTLRLMLEFRPATRYSVWPDRPARRAARRAGFEERHVTVVRLRRRRTDVEPLGGNANYSCRFMVSGHWRNQWCPSLGRHRQTWIAPYVKGPDDKPFKPTRGRAFTFTR